MGKDVIQQEILLISCSSYIRKQILENFIPHLNTPQHLIDQLEEICWNGHLEHLLPEIIERTAVGAPLFLWHIRKGPSFLHIEMSEFPLSLEKENSIDSTFFMETYIYN